MTPQTEPPPYHAAMLQILAGQWVAQTISCLARMGIADLVEAGPKSAEELAAVIGAKAGPLYRLMRATAAAGVLSEGADGKFSQTQLSAVLRTDAKPSLRYWAIFVTEEWQMRGWSQLEHCVRTGGQAPELIYGKHTFEYLQANPALAETFSHSMTALSTIESPAVAEAYDFAGIQSIVDVAGGHGLLLATVLAANPRMRGTLYDQAHVIEGAKSGPLAPLMDRCTLASGDMFVSVPAGADAYMMKYIIHDWPDEACLKILRACRAGVNPGGKLLVVDAVIKPGNEMDPAKYMDIEMLLFPGGHERTEPQFRELLAAAGWRLTRVIPTASILSIVEAVR
ncbi:MAG TPA: methyltransferase [Bryobacteraceae bacterium]|nr:methyltransferase [Bryobacteraceae bacterium]